MPEQPLGHMPDVPSDMKPAGGVLAPEEGIKPDVVAVLQKKLEEHRKRIKAVRDNVSDTDMDEFIGDDSPDEIGLGQENKLLLSSKGMRVVLDNNPGNPEPIKIHEDESRIQPSTKMLDVGSSFNDVSYNDVVFNRRAKAVPPNIVNYYPLLLTLPPAILSGKSRQAFQEISKILKILGGGGA